MKEQPHACTPPTLGLPIWKQFYALLPERDVDHSLDCHLPLIEQAIERVGAGLVILDPLMAFLGGKTDSYRDQDVRRTLSPLAKLAERTGVAVVVVRHLNKTEGKNPLYRGGGSIGIIGAARSALVVAKDPDDENRRILTPVKSNLARPAPSLAFTLEEAENGAVRVSWLGETDLSADELLNARAEERPSARQEAEEFLMELLAEGPIPVQQVKAEAEKVDIATRTVKRAKKALGIRSVAVREHGTRGVREWLWELPSGEDQPTN